MFLEATTEIASRITGAIRNAARATGASFDYLLKTALRELNLDPAAKASTSSASGLFQFIDQTWLETVKNADPALGYGRYADAIVQTPSGRYAVPDAAQRQEVMALRNDPSASSAMAATFTQRNEAILAGKLGRKPTEGELYIAHFLGPTGAGQLIQTAFAAPQTKAATVFPDAARANRNIFYGRTGARSAGQVYALLVAKHDRMQVPEIAPAGTTVAAKAAAAAPTANVASIPATQAKNPLAVLVTPQQPVSPVSVPAFAPQDGPVFHSLFQTDRRGPVSSVVSELWGAKSVQFPERARSAPAPQVAGSASAGTQAAPSKPLDLFQFLRPEICGRVNCPA